MRQSLVHRIDRLFGIAGTSSDDLALIEERLAALQPRMPWLYAMMVSCLIGMIVTFEAEREPPLIAIVMCVLTALRGLAWIKMRRQIVLGEAARIRLRSIAIATLVTTAIFAIAIAQFLPFLPPGKRQLMLVMTSTCTIALAMPMAALPGSARMSYLMFGIPAIVCFSFRHRPWRFGLGVSASLLVGTLYVGDFGRLLWSERSFFGCPITASTAASLLVQGDLGRLDSFTPKLSLTGQQLTHGLGVKIAHFYASSIRTGFGLWRFHGTLHIGG